MRAYLILSLVLLSNLSYSQYVERLNPSQALKLSKEFEIKSLPIMKALGSGDIVGNGSGLVEQTFTTAYFNIQSAIVNCLGNRYDCQVNNEDRSILREINQLFIRKIDMKRPLIFVGKEVAGDFFFDHHDQSERVAKTGFSHSNKIFINLELAKNIDNDMPTMMAILLHELGHQIGIIGHSYLDQIGAKVGSLWRQNSQKYTFDLDDLHFEISLLSNASNFVSSRISYTFMNRVKSLQQKITTHLTCEEDEVLYGFNLNNGHKERPVYKNGKLVLTMNFWLETYCESTDLEMRIEQGDLSLQFTIDGTEVKSETIVY